MAHSNLELGSRTNGLAYELIHKRARRLVGQDVSGLMQKVSLFSIVTNLKPLTQPM